MEMTSMNKKSASSDAPSKETRRKTQGHVIVKTVDNNGEILRGRYDFLRARVFRKRLCDRDPFGGDTMTLLRLPSNPVPRAKLSTSVAARATGCRWHAFCRVTR
ncbi:hypothetical protein HZH66_010969 [Vespula vulgaris]|uniref:Uncharacterized protein n=1 Tax=Vespula vulgaris TaxID=7454 RepID=A0A834MWY2_VESVU|nr:hypothetical protein HZH66_010969 [Vespula vulgaris]